MSTNIKFLNKGRYILIMEPEEALKDFGLSEKEVKVYIALLRLGTSSVNRIAEKSMLQRTTTYDILKSLTEKGLVSHVVKEKKRYFEAADPNKLLNILKEKEGRVAEIIPGLELIRKSIKEKPSITLYEGRAGMKTILEDILKTKKDFMCYASKNDLAKFFKYYFPHFVDERVNLGIKAKLILDAEPIAKELTEYKIVHKRFKTATWIYGNRIAILTLEEKEPVGIIIENEEIANTQRIVFEIMWASK